MIGGDRRIKLIAYLFAATIAISTLVLSVNVYDYVGLLNSLKKIDVSVAEMVVSPVGDELQITIIFAVINPTSYPRLRLSSLQCQLHLNIDGGEEFIGVTAYSPPLNEPLRPHQEASYRATLSIPKDRNQFLSTYGPTSELRWRIRCVINLVTPIRKYYQTMNIYATSSGPS